MVLVRESGAHLPGEVWRWREWRAGALWVLRGLGLLGPLTLAKTLSYCNCSCITNVLVFFSISAFCSAARTWVPTATDGLGTFWSADLKCSPKCALLECSVSART